MKKFVKKMSVVVVLSLLVGMLMPASSAEAASDPYLAYQTTENGAQVNRLSTYEEMEDYRVEKLLMSPGEKVDLCFIRAGWWKNAKWSSSDTNVATIDNVGMVTAKNPGVSEITLTYKKKITNKKVTVKTKVYVGEEAWGIGLGTHSWFTDVECYRMKVGTDIVLNIYGIPELDSFIYWEEWESSDKSVVKVIGDTLHAKKAGTAEVVAKILNKATGKLIEKSVIIEVTDPVETVLEDWDNTYYKLYGENYKRMFSSLALSGSSSEIEEDMLDEAYKVCGEAMSKIDFSAIKELFDLSNSASMAFEYVFYGKVRKDEERLGAIQYLISEISDESINEKYVENVSAAMEKTKSILDSMNDSHDINEAVVKIEQAGMAIEKTEIKTLVNYIKDDAVGDITKVLSEGVTLSEYLITTICLYEADTKLLDELQMCSKPGESLYDDIELLKQERKKDPIQFLKQKYIGDVAGRALCKAILKLAGKEVTAVYDAVNTVVSMEMDMAGVPSLSDTVKAQYLMEYIICLRGNIWGVRNDIANNFAMYSNEQLKREIEKYEMMYNTYLAMVEPVCDAVYELLPTGVWNQELLDDGGIPASGYDYGRHVTQSMSLFLSTTPEADETKAVKEIVAGTVEANNLVAQKKMDSLLDKLGVEDGKTVYFTVNQKSCTSKWVSGHWCANCNVGDIIKAKWFKDKFGTISTTQFPAHNVNETERDNAGQSCFGFACFAQWYVYANKTADKVVAENVGKIAYNKENLQAYLQPGDIIRVNGHSMLIYDVLEDGLMVIDSNWGLKGHSNCAVAKHLVSFERFAGHTVYVNRVVESTIGKTNESIDDSANGKHGYLDLKSIGGTWYNVGLNADFYADKEYTIYDGAKLDILGTYINKDDVKVYRVYSHDLKMECYVTARLVVLEETDDTTNTSDSEKVYGILDVKKSYNVGLDKEFYADKAYTIYKGAELEILGLYTNSKNVEVYHVYSPDLQMECYVSARYVKIKE